MLFLTVRAGHIRCAGGRINSREPMKFYQEDLVTPGIFPLRASSRKVMRDTPNLPMKPRGRPLMEQRLRIRMGDEFLGRRCNFFCAAKNCSSPVAGLARRAFSSARRGANLAVSFLRFSFFWMAEVLGMGGGN